MRFLQAALADCDGDHAFTRSRGVKSAVRVRWDTAAGGASSASGGLAGVGGGSCARGRCPRERPDGTASDNIARPLTHSPYRLALRAVAENDWNYIAVTFAVPYLASRKTPVERMPDPRSQRVIGVTLADITLFAILVASADFGQSALLLGLGR